MTDERPTHIDLFSGIGGFSLAARWAGFRTIAFCEIDKYCQKVLAKNFLADAESTGTSTNNGGLRSRIGGAGRGQGANPKLHSSIFDFDGAAYRGCDLLTGGFPCQPFSVAGKRRGAADDRHLWPEMLRVIKEARPAWVLGENVPGIIPMELDNVLSDLESIGYATRPFVIPACAVDARHRRDRLWIVCRDMANDAERSWSNGSDENSGSNIQAGSRWEAGTCSGNERTVAAAAAQGLSLPRPESRESATDAELGTEHCCRWQPEPNVGRVAHGIPARVDRLKGLGNAIVPQVAYEILRQIRNLT